MSQFFTSLILTLLLLYSASHARANTQSHFKACSEAGIRAIYILGLNDWYGDACTEQPPMPESETLQLITHLKSLHEKMAIQLGTTPAKLFEKPIAIRIELDIKGALGSYYDEKPNELSIGVFKEFKTKTFNDRVYLHELTHWVAAQPGNPLSATLGQLVQQEVLFETIADWISEEITGQVSFGLMADQDLNIPACLQNIRKKVSFKQSASHFHYSYDPAQIQKCCEASKPSQASIIGFCEQVEQDRVENSEYRKPTSAQWKARFDPAVCFEGDPALKSLSGCDPHQFSVALQSFVRDAQRLTKINLLNEFLKSKQTRILERFSNLRQFVPTSLRGKFDLLWSNQGLSVLKRFDQLKQ